LNRDQKAQVIEEVAGQIRDSEAVFAVDYRGISVPQAAELRTKLRDADATFRVVKNTLSERAADQVGADGLKELLQGPTAMTFVRGDAAAAAKALSDFRRASGGTLLEFKGGWMNGAPLDTAQIEAIARLPSRDVLYGRLVGMVASPLTGLVTGLNGLIGGLARQLQQIADQGLVGGEAAPAPEPAVESAPEPESGPETPTETTEEDN
jgi:large subunit ribosomal protein L10